jgi:hypothetical protein
MGSVATKESEDKSGRLLRKHVELAEAGQPNGGRCPMGYQRVGEKPQHRGSQAARSVGEWTLFRGSRGDPTVTFGSRPSSGQAQRLCRERRRTDMPQNWEYMTFDLTKRNTEIDRLNRLGREGWEAVAMVSSWGLGWRMVHPIVLLKRLLPEAS